MKTITDKNIMRVALRRYADHLQSIKNPVGIVLETLVRVEEMIDELSDNVLQNFIDMEQKKTPTERG